MFIPMNELQKQAERIDNVLDDLDIQHTTVNILQCLDLYGMLRCGKAPELYGNTAKWVQITLGQTPEVFMCSCCGRKVYHDGIRKTIAIHYPYCHCGAKMEVK